MKKKIVRFISYFLVGLIVMNLVFTDSSRVSKAAHSSSSVLYVAKNMELVRKGSKDTSMQHLLGSSLSSKHHAFFIKEAGKSNYTTSYCIDFTKVVENGGTLKADMKIDDTQARLINYAMLYGFNSKSYTPSSGTMTDTKHYFSTQALIWIIRAGQFYNDENRTKLENYFFKAWPDCKAKYQEIYQKVKFQDLIPSYACDYPQNKDNVLKLEWKEATGKFEGEWTNTYTTGEYSANKTVKVDTSSLPSGVSVTIDGEKVKVTSTTEYTDKKTIKFTKGPEMKGKVVCWDVSKAGKQPQATLDYDENAIVRSLFINIQTGKKPTPPTPTPTTAPPTPTTAPPTPVPTTAPPVCTTVPPVATTQPPVCTTAPPVCTTQPPVCTEMPPVCPTEPVAPKPTYPVATETPVEEIPSAPIEEVQDPVEEKVIEQVVEDEMDDVPATGDSSNLRMVFILLGAALFAMALSVAPTVYRRIKNRI